MKTATGVATDFKQIGMQNADLAIERLSGDCLPEQFIRELYKNAEEAILRTGEGDTIQIESDSFFEKQFGVPKFSVADNGPGMSQVELEDKLNLFANVSGQQRNYGVGGKLASLARSHRKDFGVVIRTWQNGVGTIGYLSYSPASYRVAPMPTDDGIKPRLIKNHGTIVTVLGHSDNDNTMEAPEGASTRTGPRWIQQYVQSKFWIIPKNITLKIHAFETDSNRTAKGLSMYLEPLSEKAGDAKLPNMGFIAHWYLLPETDKNAAAKEKRGIGRADQFRNFTEIKGQVCVLSEDEIYDVQRYNTGSLFQFGIHTGSKRVVIVLEPVESEKYVANITRSSVAQKFGSGTRPINFSKIGAEFNSHMPTGLKDYMNESRGQTKATGVSYMDRTLYEVHGYDFYLDSKGKHLLPAGMGIVNNPPNMGDGRNTKPRSGDASTKTPLPVTDGLVPTEPTDDGGRRKRFSRRGGLPEFSVEWQSASDIGNKYDFVVFAEGPANGKHGLFLNKEWHEIEALKRIIARQTKVGESTDSLVQEMVEEAIKEHLERQVKDVVLTTLEALEHKFIDNPTFRLMTSTPALTAACTGRWGLLAGIKQSVAMKVKGLILAPETGEDES